MGPVNQTNLVAFMASFYRTCQSHLMAILLTGNKLFNGPHSGNNRRVKN